MNKYNNMSYKKAVPYYIRKYKAKEFNQRSSKKYKRYIHLSDMKSLGHYCKYYYFNDEYKGVQTYYIRGEGVYNIKTRVLLKSYEDDPILGWYFKWKKNISIL